MSSNTVNKIRDSLLKGIPKTSTLSSTVADDCDVILRTGLLDLDLNVMTNNDGTNRGFKYGRSYEFVGPQGTLKTRLILEICAKHLLQDENNLVLWQDSEGAFDYKYFSEILELNGVPRDRWDNILRTRAQDTNRVLVNMKKLIESFEEEAAAAVKKPENKGKKVWEVVPRVIFVLDSLAALISTEDLDRLDKALAKIDDGELGADEDPGPKVGAGASEMHRMFKYSLTPFQEYGVMFLFTNHMRADLGPSRRTTNYAHDIVVRHYISARFATSNYTSDSERKKRLGEKMSLGQSYTAGQALVINKAKIRGPGSFREFTLDYYNDNGFDYDQAWIDGMLTCGLLRNTKGGYGLVDDEILPPEVREELAEVFYDKSKTTFKDKDLLSFFKDEPKLKEAYTEAAYLLGPRRVKKE